MVAMTTPALIIMLLVPLVVSSTLIVGTGTGKQVIRSRGNLQSSPGRPVNRSSSYLYRNLSSRFSRSQHIALCISHSFALTGRDHLGLAFSEGRHCPKRLSQSVLCRQRLLVSSVIISLEALSLPGWHLSWLRWPHSCPQMESRLSQPYPLP